MWKHWDNLEKLKEKSSNGMETFRHLTEEIMETNIWQLWVKWGENKGKFNEIWVENVGVDEGIRVKVWGEKMKRILTKYKGN